MLLRLDLTEEDTHRAGEWRVRGGQVSPQIIDSLFQSGLAIVHLFKEVKVLLSWITIMARRNFF